MHAKRGALLFSSLALVLAPKCPLCVWGLLGMFGTASVAGSIYASALAPLTIVWLALTVATIAYRGTAGPALTALAAAIVIAVGKFLLDLPLVVYAGIAVLLAAAVWRARSRPARCASME